MKKIITVPIICLFIFCAWYFYPCFNLKGTYSRTLNWENAPEVECVVIGDKYYEAIVSDGEKGHEACCFDGQRLNRETPFYDYQLKPLRRMIIVDRHSALTPKDYRLIKLGWNKIYEWNYNQNCWVKCEKIKDKAFIKRISSEDVFPKINTAMSNKWESTLIDHLANVETLDILENFDHHELTVTNVDDIFRLIKIIKIDEEASTSLHTCLQPKTFIFKEGTNQLVTIFYHTHDFDRLRESADDNQIYLYWRYGKWPNVHAVLTPKSSKQFAEWLTAHNLKTK